MNKFPLPGGPFAWCFWLGLLTIQFTLAVIVGAPGTLTWASGTYLLMARSLLDGGGSKF